MKIEELYNDWVSVFNLCFDEINVTECIVHVILLPNDFTFDSRMIRFVAEVLCYRVSAAIHIFQPRELLARSFIVSATALEFVFSSLCLFASTADSRKLFNHYYGGYSTKRCIFVQKSPRCRQNKSRGVISVPSCNVKPEINIF